MTLYKKIYPMTEDYDHDRVIWQNHQQIKGRGFMPKKDNPNKKICLLECPNCSKENYIMYVAKGKCAFCGFDANKDNDNA